MSLRRSGALIALVFLLLEVRPATAQIRHPLRLVPADADLVLMIERPGALLDAVLRQESLREFNQLEAVREFYNSTNARRFYQLLGHVQKQLGLDRRALVDRLAGAGITAAVRFGEPPGPAVLIIQGKDEKLVQQFVRLGADLAEQELDRFELKGVLEKTSYRGIDGFHVGPGLYLMSFDATIVVATTEEAMNRVVDLHLDGTAKSIAETPGMIEGRKLAGADQLAWLWVNFDRLRADEKFKVAFDTFTKDPSSAIVLGGLADVLKRSPFLCLGLAGAKDGFHLSLRCPRGREGMGEAARLVLPEGPEASLPLLEPRNVLVSLSYHLDLKRFYDNRDRLLNKKQQEGLDKLEKNTKGLLPPSKLEELVSQALPYQRFVYAHADSSAYKSVPKVRFGSFALVQETRGPEFGKTMEPLLRAIGVIGSVAAQVKMVEEKRGDVTLVGYRFPDDGTFKGDRNDVRYNFSPCFAQVGNHFMVSSTVELGRDLVALLQREDSRPKAQPAVVQVGFYWSGLASTLKSNKDTIVSQGILGQALTPETARQQADLLVRLVDRLGTVRFESHYNATDTRYDVYLRLPAQERCCD